MKVGRRGILHRHGDSGIMLPAGRPASVLNTKSTPNQAQSIVKLDDIYKIGSDKVKNSTTKRHFYHR